VRVVVQSFAGKELELEVQPAQTVKQMKASVQQHWSMPAVCQQMLVGTTVLADLTAIGEYCADVPPGDRLRVLCIYSLPYDGDVHKASLAGDRDAVRALMTQRDKDREQTACPAIIMLIINRSLRSRKGWPRIGEALLQRGYAPEAVDAALQQMPHEYCYLDVLEHLELSLGKIKDNKVPLLQWWKKE